MILALQLGQHRHSFEKLLAAGFHAAPTSPDPKTLGSHLLICLYCEILADRQVSVSQDLVRSLHCHHGWIQIQAAALAESALLVHCLRNW